MSTIIFDNSHKNSRFTTIVDQLNALDNAGSNEVKIIIASVEELRDYLHISDEKALKNEARIDSILEALLRFTILDLSQKAEVGELGDDLDAIAVGINTLAEELEEKIKIETRNSERLSEQNIKLERMNKELSSFAYVSSHDLQEPLRKINTYISRILEEETEKLPEQIKFYLGRIHSSASRMQKLIKDILEYSQLTNPGSESILSDLNVLVSEWREEFEENLNEIKAVFNTGKLCSLKIVPFQFKRLLNNLVSNSIKFKDPGRPLLIDLDCEIQSGKQLNHPELSALKNYYHLKYSDNGIGFNPIYNQKIFEVFQRLHNESSYKGTGVGLAICKRIVENHGGLITAEGVPGVGVTFHIYLP